MTIEGAWATPDGAWRVEIVRHGRTRRYQIVYGDNRIDWLSIAAVERILGEAGIDMADLVEVAGDSPPPAGHGVA
jgi:bifunctional non-homologous end joining protein LigD